MFITYVMRAAKASRCANSEARRTRVIASWITPATFFVNLSLLALRTFALGLLHAGPVFMAAYETFLTEAPGLAEFDAKRWFWLPAHFLAWRATMVEFFIGPAVWSHRGRMGQGTHPVTGPLGRMPSSCGVNDRSWLLGNGGNARTSSAGVWWDALAMWIADEVWPAEAASIAHHGTYCVWVIARGIAATAAGLNLVLATRFL